MNLFLMRHAHAAPADGVPDRERPLTERGRKQAGIVAYALRERGHAVDRIVSSPLRRARETAEVMARLCGVAAVEIEDALAPSGEIPDIRPYLDESVGFRNVLVVAHHPDIALLANSYGAPQIFLTPGAVAVFEKENGRPPEYRAMVSPETLPPE